MPTIVDADYDTAVASLREALRAGTELTSTDKRKALLVIIDSCERLTDMKATVAAGSVLATLQAEVAAIEVPGPVSIPALDGDGDGGGY